MKVLETFWRATIAAVCLSFLFGVIASLVALAQPGPLSAKVRVMASYSLARCGREMPILTEFHNDSRRTIGQIDLKFEARKPGFSTNLVSYEQGHSTMDSIMPPGVVIEACYAVPALDLGSPSPASLSYSANVWSADEYRGPDTTPAPPPIISVRPAEK